MLQIIKRTNVKELIIVSKNRYDNRISDFISANDYELIAQENMDDINSGYSVFKYDK